MTTYPDRLLVGELGEVFKDAQVMLENRKRGSDIVDWIGMEIIRLAGEAAARGKFARQSSRRS